MIGARLLTIAPRPCVVLCAFTRSVISPDMCGRDRNRTDEKVVTAHKQTRDKRRDSEHLTGAVRPRVWTVKASGRYS